MKTLFMSDLHLEAGRDLGYGDYGPGSRFDDQVRVLDRVADLAVAEGCGVVCVVGDVFHKPTPSPWAILAFQDFVRTLKRAGMLVIVLAGNHDVKAAGLPTALEVYDHSDEIGMARVFTKPHVTPYRFLGSDQIVAFACLPWTPMSTLIANEGRTPETRERAIDLLVATMKQLREKCATEHPDATPILLAHWSVSGSSLPNGLPVDQLSEPVIPWFDIDALNWGLVALGHIHNAGLVGGDMAATRMFYCGSTAVCNLGELAVDHGVWIYDHEADHLAFHAIEDRPFHDWEADAVLTYDDKRDVVLVRADGEKFPLMIPEPGAIARIRYRANGLTVNEADIRDAAIELGAHKVFIKEIDKPQISRSRITTPIDDVAPSDALNLYIEAQDLLARRNGDGPAFIDKLRERHAHYIERTKA